MKVVCLVVIVLMLVSLRRVVDREGGSTLQYNCGVGAAAAMITETTGHEKALMEDPTNEEEDEDEDDDDENYYAEVEEAYAAQHQLYTAIVVDAATTNLDAIWDLFHCPSYHQDAAGPLPIHTDKVWTFLRGVYIGTVGYRNSTLRYETGLWQNGYADAAALARTRAARATPTSKQDSEYHDSSEPHAASSSSSVAAPPILVKYHPHKGRAVYANQFFEKGAVVRTSDYTACFSTGALYRQFLVALPPPLACDVLEWAYSGTDYGICVDLDEGSYMNHASTPVYDPNTGTRLRNPRTRYYEASTQEVPNVSQDRALRDIQIGEELLTDYEEFADVDAWSDFGLGGWPAPEDDDDDDEDDDDEFEDEDDEDEGRVEDDDTNEEL